MSEFTINDEFGYDKDYSYLDSVINKTLEVEKVSNAVFSIIFVSEDKIKEINRLYRNKDSITDVISFAFEDNGFMPGDLRVLGDIYICIPRMIEQAKAYSHSEKRELSFLVVHGLLHLLGYDHTLGEKEEKEMFQKQDDILESLNILR